MRNSYYTAPGEVQLKIESKKLQSGKCQVKFYVMNEGTKNLYGYALVESGRTVNEVVNEIKNRLEGIQGYESYCQSHLFSIQKNHRNFDGNFMIFRN